MFQYMSKNLKIPQPQLTSWFNFSAKRGQHDRGVTEKKKLKSSNKIVIIIKK